MRVVIHSATRNLNCAGNVKVEISLLNVIPAASNASYFDGFACV